MIKARDLSSSAVEQQEESVLRSLRHLERLVSPYGLVAHSTELPRIEGDPPFHVYVSGLGDISRVATNGKPWNSGADTGNLNGVGSDLDPERARLISVAESLERYANCLWDENDLIYASEEQLDEDFISTSAFPQCSSAEYASNDCALERSDPSIPIRWVKGWSLTRRCHVLVPAVYVYLNMEPISPSEHFTRSVTTGSAVHFGYRQAILNGILEIVERDSFAISWLNAMELPEVTIDAEELKPSVRRAFEAGGAYGSTVRIFDATSDVGIPALVAIELNNARNDLAQIVCVTSDFDPQQAVSKLFRELASLRIALNNHVARHDTSHFSPNRVSVVGGAAYSAARGRRERFAHLLKNTKPMLTLSQVGIRPAEKDKLDFAVMQWKSVGAEVIVVDMTPREAKMIGMRAVKVVIPQAMPLSFIHGERFLATPRLYSAPVEMGYPRRRESDLNPNPQPLA